MPLPPRPDWTRWSDTESYLHALVKELKERVDLLEEYVAEQNTWPWEEEEVADPRPSPPGYTFVFVTKGGTNLFCNGTLHVFEGGNEMCGCGFVPRPE